MLNTPLYDFGLVIHYTTLPGALREVSSAGFDVDVEVYDMEGDEVASRGEVGGTKWFHLLARAPAGPLDLDLLELARGVEKAELE